MSAQAELFMRKENRDRAWREAGKPGRRSSSRGQILSPHYVSDYEEVTGTPAEDKGIMNHSELFAVLYTWDELR